jgi:Heparinase II/III-like protein
MKFAHIVIFVLAIFGFVTTAHADHPEILVHSADRDVIKTKIEQSAWAKKAYDTLKARVDRYLNYTKTDPKWLSSRLFMNWQTHYTIPITQNERWIGGDGHAPVPTPRFARARNWATNFIAPPELEDLKPFNDQNGKVWLINKQTSKGEWVDPGLSGRTMESVNERIIQLAADAGFIYWLTGDESYAKFGSEILWTYMNGFAYVQPPRVPPSEHNTAKIIGTTSFEVIHENIMLLLSESYDFLNPYLQTQGKDVGLIQTQLKRMADRVIDGGGREGNWDINQAMMIAYAGLALEENEKYPDHKGRPYYEDVVLNADLPNQLGLTRIMKTGYDQKTALWPEAPGYGFGVTQQIVQITSLMLNDPAGQAVLKDPLLDRAALAQLELIYPNGFSVGVGDTDNTRLGSRALEFLIASARRQSDTDVENRLTAALQREIDTGNYDRTAQSDIVALTQFVRDLKSVPPAQMTLSRTYFGAPLDIVMQRNPSDANHALAAAMYGTEGGHVHANGMAIELYGSGIIMGADPGRGASYWTADHGEYYSQPPAHNTVIINGRSNYSINPHSNIAMKADLAEPAFGKAALSPNISFVQGSFAYPNIPAEQQRTLALVRTSPTSGFYFDVFRSRATSDGPMAGSNFHDYIYHNIGQSLMVDDGEKPLVFSASQLLGSNHGNLKGYDYFKDEKSVEYTGNLHATFSAQLLSGPRHNMGLWMVGQKDRRVFSVNAPADHAGRPWLPKDLLDAPMPTLLVRQTGDAWRRPFITVFEPYLSSDGATIRSVRTAKVETDDADLAACFVKVQLNPQTPIVAYLFQDDQPSKLRHVEGYAFQGSFGMVQLHSETITELYLGNGCTIGNEQISITTTSDSPTSAFIIRTANGWRCSASAPVKLSIIFPLPVGANATNQLTMMCKTAHGEKPAENASLQIGNSSIIATCILASGLDQELLIVRADHRSPPA